MKSKQVIILITLIVCLCVPIIMILAQEEEPVTLRTLTVDWYEASRVGVKLQYRGYDNTPNILYLPRSFEKKYYRFVRAPRETAQQGLPILIIRMRGKEVLFIDIYTQFEDGKAARIAKFNEKDMEKFREVESSGRIEMKF
ncbi:MAG: hypothetical protein ACUVWJ_02775 [Spirochaetota bacterium]